MTIVYTGSSSVGSIIETQEVVSHRHDDANFAQSHTVVTDIMTQTPNYSLLYSKTCHLRQFQDKIR